MGCDQCRGSNVQGICCQHEIGLMIRKKLKYSGQNRPFGEVIAQHFRRQPGQRQQSLGPRLLRQHPGER